MNMEKLFLLLFITLARSRVLADPTPPQIILALVRIIQCNSIILTNVRIILNSYPSANYPRRRGRSGRRRGRRGRRRGTRSRGRDWGATRRGRSRSSSS